MNHDWATLVGKRVEYTTAYKNLLIQAGETDPAVLNKEGTCVSKVDIVSARQKLAIMHVIWNRKQDAQYPEQTQALPDILVEEVPSWWLRPVRRRKI